MLMVMDMSTGKIIENEFDGFEDEVMNAEWLPPQPGLQLGLQEVHHSDPAVPEEEAEAFLQQVYRSQQ
jgi:hypothetical protein